LILQNEASVVHIYYYFGLCNPVKIVNNRFTAKKTADASGKPVEDQLKIIYSPKHEAMAKRKNTTSWL